MIFPVQAFGVSQIPHPFRRDDFAGKKRRVGRTDLIYGHGRIIGNDGDIAAVKDVESSVIRVDSQRL